MSIFSHHSRSSSKRGFTLIELLVVMAIMVVVTTVMLFKQSRFDSSTILRSLAYSVALSMRQAQVYGTSVLGTTTPQAACNTTASGSYNAATGNCYASAYGIYFNASTPGQYILFVDLNGNLKYDAGEDIKIFTLSPGYSITQFCASGTNSGVPITSPGRCSPATINSVSIVFKRPNPDALFYADFSGTPIAGDTYSSVNVQIKIQADLSSIRSATVTSTGLISAQ